MEYIVSARKYRPMTFDSVVGQSSLTTTLKNAVSSGKLAHAYLFCGPRGVGKTTCARIFAKVINCLTPTQTGDACGECESCKAFDEGRSMNIFELDAASNNGVEHIKALMDQTRIPPQSGKYKVFIIDEVHMLSTAAFNAFLKTLEEPPAHVIFILATTEKHKILPTIISRCQIYDFERMTVQGIIGHLKNVAEKEGIQYEEQALNVIAEKADGGMRDALSIFDQAASFCQGNITYEKVLEDLNVLDADNYFNIVALALENKVSDIMLLFNNVLSRGFDAGKFINGLASHMRNLLMAVDPQTTQLIETSEAQRNKYTEQAARCKPQFLYQALKILNQCDVNYRQSSNKRLLCELTLIQVAQITQPDDSSAGAGRRPCERLKTLFKKAMKEVQSSVASQVAQTATTSSTGSVAATTGVKLYQAAPASAGMASEKTPSSVKAVPKLRMGNIGVSFSRIMNGDKKEADKKEEEELKPTTDEYEQFDDDDLRREWLSMCKRMMQNIEYTAIAMRMQNIQLHIDGFPHVKAIVENRLLLDDLAPLMPRIVVTMATYLHNSKIDISLELGKPVEIIKRLTPREFIQRLLKEDSDFAAFKEALMLELE